MRQHFTIWIALVFLLLSGCAKEKHPIADVPNGPTDPTLPPGVGGRDTPLPPGQGPDGTQWKYGSSVPLQYSSIYDFREYVGRHVGEPQNLRMHVVMDDMGEGQYGGTLRIQYTENGLYHDGEFTTGRTLGDTQYNVWFQSGSRSVFHAFFQDEMGALVLVLDEVLDFGDGQGPELASGSVWFQNFQQTGAVQGYKMCWLIDIGPFDCRTFIKDGRVQPRSSIYPNNSGSEGPYGKPRPLYKELAKFENLKIKQAFSMTE